LIQIEFQSRREMILLWEHGFVENKAFSSLNSVQIKHNIDCFEIGLYGEDYNKSSIGNYLNSNIYSFHRIQHNNEKSSQLVVDNGNQRS
jgi:hypothetical protein